MLGFGFGIGHRDVTGERSSATGGETVSYVLGALTRNDLSAGIPISAGAILSGDANGHWTIGGGRLYPSAAGDASDLNAGPYTLGLDDGSTAAISIEPDTWDFTDQSEWDFDATQSASTLAGKAIALRNPSLINLCITDSFGTPFRRADLRDGDGNPLVIKGRFGTLGDWTSYVEINKVQTMRGVRGITFRHLRASAVVESKFVLVGESSNHTDNVTIEDCWICGAVGDPNGNYTSSSNYPNLNLDLITTTGSANGAVGNITVRNCRVEWGDSLINIRVDRLGSKTVITGNELSYF